MIRRSHLRTWGFAALLVLLVVLPLAVWLTADERGPVSATVTQTCGVLVQREGAASNEYQIVERPCEGR